MDKEEIYEEKRKSNNLILIIIVGIVLLLLGGFIGFYLGGGMNDSNNDKAKNDGEQQEQNNSDEEKKPEEESKDDGQQPEEDNDGQQPEEDNDGEEEKENDEVVEEVPSDGDLIARSKELIKNFSDLLAVDYGYGSKSYSFSNLVTEVFKLDNQREFANIIGNTFVDNTTAWKYVPYYEKDGIYYCVDGTGGFMGAGSFIFEYKVENKTTSTAHVRIEYIECYDEVVPDKISACQNNPWNEVSVIILDLSKVDGKWLISSMDTDKAFSILK